MSNQPDPAARARIERIRLVRFVLPLAQPMRTSYGVEAERDVILVHVTTSEAEGWGENVALTAPSYLPEYAATSFLALRDHVVPALFANASSARSADVAPAVGNVRGWQMAKCALEAAVLDAELRGQGRSLAEFLGATSHSVAPGVAVGLCNGVDETLEAVDLCLAEGYRRIKLKIEPGRDVDLVAAVRARVGDEVALQVDANGAYALDDAGRLGRLDEFGLLLIEQPFPADELAAHASLARLLRTPLCLDESITSVRDARAAVELCACAIINIIPGRVGGYLEAKRIHDFCLAENTAVLCGGMFETGVGRAANLALAAMDGFRLPPDLSASSRYFLEDITEPFVLADGEIAVPTGPGIGVVPDAERLRELDAVVTELRPN